MHSISEVARQTGFTAHTLRYYEKIGLLSSPLRNGGRRAYTPGEVRMLKFVKILKQTGMSLDDIQEFLQDGCLLENNESERKQLEKIGRRSLILEKHLLTLEEQRQNIDDVIKITKEKLETYKRMTGEIGNEK